MHIQTESQLFCSFLSPKSTTAVHPGILRYHKITTFSYTPETGKNNISIHIRIFRSIPPKTVPKQVGKGTTHLQTALQDAVSKYNKS
jgi:hypothetical protein